MVRIFESFFPTLLFSDSDSLTTQSTKSPLLLSSLSFCNNNSPIKSVSNCENKIEQQGSTILTIQSTQILKPQRIPSPLFPSHNDSSIQSVSKSENNVDNEELNVLTIQSTQNPLFLSSPSSSQKDSPITSVSKDENKVKKEDSDSLTTQRTKSPLLLSSLSFCNNTSPTKEDLPVNNILKYQRTPVVELEEESSTRLSSPNSNTILQLKSTSAPQHYPN